MHQTRLITRTCWWKWFIFSLFVWLHEQSYSDLSLSVSQFIELRLQEMRRSTLTDGHHGNSFTVCLFTVTSPSRSERLWFTYSDSTTGKTQSKITETIHDVCSEPKRFTGAWWVNALSHDVQSLPLEETNSLQQLMRNLTEWTKSGRKFIGFKYREWMKEQTKQKQKNLEKISTWEKPLEKIKTWTCFQKISK